MTFQDVEWIIPILAAVGFLVGFLIKIKQQKIQGISEVIDTITTKYLDDRKFRYADLTQDLKLPDEVAKQALKELERRDIIYRTKTGYYQLNDPLVFLSEQDMIRAKRLTKGDNIIYGAYQHPFFSHKQLLLVYAIFIGTVIFALVCAFVPSANAWIMGLLPQSPTPAQPIDVAIFLLFIVLVGMVITDAMDNLISVWSRERYSVIIGENSGISYDQSYSDEFSGRIGRGQIRQVDINFSTLQKFANYFMRIPVGDIIINKGTETPAQKAPKSTPAKTTKAKTTKTTKTTTPKAAKVPGTAFKNMPFPREMFYVIRSLQLRSLGWRQRHARTLMLWRAHGAIPSINF